LFARRKLEVLATEVNQTMRGGNRDRKWDDELVRARMRAERLVVAVGLGAILLVLAPISFAEDDEDLAGREAVYSQFAMGVYLLERGEVRRAIPMLDFAWRESDQDPTVGSRLAEAYYAVRELDKSESVVDDVLEDHPDREELLRLKARLRYSQRDAAGAIAVLEMARTLKPSLETERLLASLYMETGDVDKALDSFERCLRIDPSNGLLHAIYGEMLLDSGRHDEAEAEFRSSLQLDPLNYRAIESLVSLLESEGRLKEAVSILEDAAGDPAATAELRVKLAQAYLEAERPDDGIRVLETLRKEAELSPEAALLLGRLYYETERYQDALGVFAPLAERADDSPELHRILGELYVKTGDTEKARASFERAIAAAPKDFRNYLALFFAHSTEFEKKSPRVELSPREASALLSKAAELAPAEDFDANFMVGMAYLSVDSLGLARTHLERADALRPDDRGVLFNLAAVHEKSHEFERAEPLLARLHDSHPDDAAVSNFYGYVLAEMGKDLDLAEELVRKALAKEPDNGYFIDSLGWVLYKKGDYRAAATELERAIDKLGEDPVILEHLGDAYAALTRYKDALHAYRQSRKLHDSQALREKIESTQRRMQ
jgi:tetratricopeptide (TPR) repeat protein